MSAAGRQNSLFVSGADQLADVDPSHRACRAAGIFSFYSNSKDRFSEAIFQSAGDDFDHARMPGFSADKEKFTIVLLQRLFDGFLDDHGFNGLTLTIMELEKLCKRNCFGVAARGEQLGAETAASDPSASIDPRTERESQ